MPSNLTLLFSNQAPADPAQKALAEIYPTVALNDAESELPSSSASARFAGLVIDCRQDEALARQTETLNRVLGADLPIVFLNVDDANILAGLCGTGFKTGCAVLRPYKRGTKILQNFDPLVQREPGEGESIQVLQKSSGERLHQPPQSETHDGAAPTAPVRWSERSVESRATTLRQCLSAPGSFDAVDELMDADPPGALPTGQTHTVYIQDNHSEEIGDGQVFNNQVTFACSMVASYDDPPYKYLWITSAGAGFHPANGGDLWKNSTYPRGYFQNTIKLDMRPENTLTTYQTSPRNTNHQSSVTTSSSFTVGVDVAKNPAFKPSYTLGKSTTETIADFKIGNDSSGRVAKWEYQLGKTASSVWNIFDEPFMRKARVEGLPALAKSNLQPSTTGVWYVGNHFSGSVDVQVGWYATYLDCWVTGDWTDYTMRYQSHYYNWGYWLGGNPVRFNFGLVNPQG